MKSKVFFCKTISPETIVKMYDSLGIALKGNLAIKVHSGEEGNQNYIHWDFYKPIFEKLNGTMVETNTAYEGQRNTTEKHLQLLKKHGWNNYKFDILDSEKDDCTIPITYSKHIKCNYVGSHIFNYDSMLVISHFKGHPNGGYGGALKQLSIGCASSIGKAWIHSAGYTNKIPDCWNHMDNLDGFLECMAAAAKSIHDLFKHKGGIAYISIMKNMSVDCDCCAVAEDPCIKDIGILASLDPVAIDRACLDLVLNSKDEGVDHFMERVNSLHGTHTIEEAVNIGIGSTEYELIEIK